MFAFEEYHPIYLAICWLMSFVGIIYYMNPTNRKLRIEKGALWRMAVWAFAIFFIIFFGFRPYENDIRGYMMDTEGYANYFKLMQTNPDAYYRNTITDSGGLNWRTDVFFDLIMQKMADWDFSVSAWFTVVAAIYILPLMFVIKRWFPNNYLLAFLFIITSFTFYSGAINGIRNADATSLFTLGITLVAIKKFDWKSILIGVFLIWCSYYFHHSIYILLAALIASYLVVKNTNFAISIWVIAIIISLFFGNALANVGVDLFDETGKAGKYLDRGDDSDVMSGFSQTGFRWDFLIYSAMPILFGWYVTIKKGIKDRTYQILLNTYILANAVWVVFIYAAYNNRFAALSWSLYPFVLLYPLVRYNIWGVKQSSYTVLILLAQLIFVSIF